MQMSQYKEEISSSSVINYGLGIVRDIRMDTIAFQHKSCDLRQLVQLRTSKDRDLCRFLFPFLCLQLDAEETSQA